jgi:hypothetical protein
VESDGAGSSPKRTRRRKVGRQRGVVSADGAGSDLAGTAADGDVSPSSIFPPAPKTLEKYGLTLAGWLDLYARAGGLCEVCRGKTKRLCVDHEHVKGWKKMAPEQRLGYVRGLLCWRCNVGIVGRSVTVSTLASALAYLSRYQAAKAATTDRRQPGDAGLV